MTTENQTNAPPEAKKRRRVLAGMTVLFVAAAVA